MHFDDDACYRALTARDTRFDGLFFVGVKSTGIYCRPVCTAKTPGRNRCRFFAVAALAEQAGFRPCLRCRPELAPGHAPVDSARTIARAAAARIEAGALNDRGSLEELASGLGLSSRQLRRSVRKEFGVSPVELAQTNRLLLAKRLIAETQLPMVQVAFAAGFESVRRFNALFRSHYRLTPSTLRHSTSQGNAADCLRLTLAYRPPLDWAAMLGFLSALAPALPSLLVRLRNLFDLDARPDIIAGQLALDPLLARLVELRPGLRVPGAFDSFELGIRAILGQQVSVRGASTLAGRFAERFGEAIETPWACLNRVTPTAAVLSAVRSGTLAGLGLPSARAESLRTFASAVSRGEIDLDPGPDPTMIVGKLRELPGIGPWTAEYIAMRALRWPDAFPTGDLGLMKALGSSSAKAMEKAAEPWRPWRAYAAMHLWESLKTLRKRTSRKE
ncbi:MAG: helix-turn-helix domain-containing protein [Planctomycetia bacterium]|nr:helix-turn-helix domain-containing protein [Planctomycetia bacterium]